MTGPVAVAHLITKLELGGAQQNTLFTVAHLDRTRFRPILVTGEPGPLDDAARALAGVEFHGLPDLVRPISPRRDLRALAALTDLLRRLRPAIVHTHSSKAGIVGRWAAYRAGVPIIVHSIHGFGFTPAQPAVLRTLLIAAERATGRITTRFFSVSEANRRQGIALGLFAPERCAVVRSGIDPAAYRNVSVDRRHKRRELGLAPDLPTVGMIAPFKPQKAPLDFVRAAALVQQARPAVQFLLVGDGELKSAVIAETARLGLDRALKLAGWRRDIPAVMRALDVLVLTSRWEGLPRVYLEALASGVPVVGTRVDGAEEVVRGGVNGYLCEPGDLGGLAGKISAVLDDPQMAGRAAASGRALFPEFDIHRMVRRQEDEYTRLLAARETGKSL